MFVVKRSGRTEGVNFEKITRRLEALKNDKAIGDVLSVDVVPVVASVCSSLRSGIATKAIDELTAGVAASMTTEHPEYGVLAARILVSDLQKSTSDSLVVTYRKMAAELDPAFLACMRRNAKDLQPIVDYTRDYDFDYFGFKTLERMYLARVDGVIVERPQHMWMRVAVALWGDDMVRVKETYDLLSTRKFTHASPTLFNAGMKTQQLASCFLTGVEEDSLDAIFKSITDCARISKYGGGIGIHVSGVRSKGAPIKGTNGVSDGLVPMLRVLNATATYVNQGGKRKGAIAVYIEPHHPDIIAVLELKRNSGDEHLRARDLFYAVYASDLFMRRVEANASWSLFDPSTAPGLADVWGKEYEDLYEKYEAEGRAVRVVRAQDVWFETLRSQVETGTPYIVHKDHVNGKSNQSNLGTIKCSNLCAEITEYSGPGEVAVCTLASMNLPEFVRDGAFDYAAFMAAVRVAARNLDRVIDINAHPVPEATTSNMRHRPVGLGVQGLQDVFQLLKIPFDSPEAAALNVEIFASLYFAAISESCALAERLGAYETFPGSPASEGKLQFDLWGVEPSPDHDWAGLKARIAAHGLRNSLSVAPMPTASTANIFGNYEGFEPAQGNIFSRRTLAGEFAVVNKHLVRDLTDRGLWTPAMKNEIIARDGGVQDIASFPEDLRPVYKTVWDLSMKTVIDMAADRGAYVCQSQSMNLFVAEPTFKKLSSMHFHSWKRGLKTGMYYLRTKPAARAVQITVDPCLACSA